MKERYSGNDPHPYSATTNTTISFDFYNPEDVAESPFAPPRGMTLEETTRALLVGQFPVGDRGGSPQSPPPSPIQSLPPSPAQSAISISSDDIDMPGHAITAPDVDPMGSADGSADGRCGCECLCSPLT